LRGVESGLNISALIAVVIFAAVLLAVFGAVYVGALRSYRRGELESKGIRILRWALLGHVIIFVILGIAAFLA
jgi:hypothetical protein